MRATPILLVFAAVACSGVQAEVVRCVAGPPQVAAEFEVWKEPLPAPDYLVGYDACVARAVSTPSQQPPASPWHDNQRTSYTNALKKQRVDILVAPFQNQGYGLERTQRALMSADLAYQVDPAVRVADPFLTARALGEGLRSYDRNDIVELARAVGARTVVVGYVGHDRAHRMTVTVQVLKLDGGGDAIAAIDTLNATGALFHSRIPTRRSSCSTDCCRRCSRASAAGRRTASSACSGRLSKRQCVLVRRPYCRREPAPRCVARFELARCDDGHDRRALARACVRTRPRDVLAVRRSGRRNGLPAGLRTPESRASTRSARPHQRRHRSGSRCAARHC